MNPAAVGYRDRLVVRAPRFGRHAPATMKLRRSRAIRPAPVRSRAPTPHERLGAHGVRIHHWTNNFAETVDGQVDSEVELQWQSGVDILWIVGPDQVHRIMKSADGIWKLYLDSEQNLPAGIG